MTADSQGSPLLVQQVGLPCSESLLISCTDSCMMSTFSADPVKINVAVILLRVKLQSKMNLPTFCLKCKAACPVG